MIETTTAIASLKYSWDAVRDQFDLAGDCIHLGASQFIASHPRPVREAIERHRQALEHNPVLYVEENEDRLMQAVREAAADYLRADDPNEFALTDSTTLGLGLLYAGLPLKPGDEILYTDHQHSSHLEAIRGAVERSGVSRRKVELYEESAAGVDADALVDTVIAAIGRQTRAVAVTWVQSDTGLKFPVGRLGERLARLNEGRDRDKRVRLCVDGVHGFGIEIETLADLRCDFFAAGMHKWLYGPRGTGLLWGRMSEWREMIRVIPSFTEVMDAYSEDKPLPPMDGRQFTPGGFHSLEHRWAAAQAFEFAEQVGRKRIATRVHELNRQCKEGLAAMSHVTLHTPMSDELSAGITAFEVRGISSKEAKESLQKKGIVATVAPYPTAYLRFTPGIINTPDEVEAGLAAIRELA
ncbi:MAG: aminotransferase class V-fold PLP-dependent enzyme [Blastocatellia bacterium]